MSKIAGEASYQALFEATIIFLVKKSKGRIKVVYSCIEKIFEYPNAELLRQTVENLLTRIPQRTSDTYIAKSSS